MEFLAYKRKAPETWLCLAQRHGDQPCSYKVPGVGGVYGVQLEVMRPRLDSRRRQVVEQETS